MQSVVETSSVKVLSSRCALENIAAFLVKLWGCLPQFLQQLSALLQMLSFSILSSCIYCVDTCTMLNTMQLHVIYSGIRANRYDSLRRAIVQTYGYQHAFTMSNLEKAGEGK